MRKYGGYGNLVIWLYLCILLLCIFRPLIFLALNTQSGHWVDDGAWITEVVVVVNIVCCLIFGLFCWVSLGSRLDMLPWSFQFIFWRTHRELSLLQDRVLVLCGVDTRHDNAVVVFFAMNAGRDGMIRVFEDSLDDVDPLCVQKSLMLCTRRALSVDIPMTFRKRRCCACTSFFALIDADASKGAS